MKQILIGDCIEKLKELPDASVNCIVTSPPYYGLRDYGCDEQIGLEETPEEYINKLVDVFRECRRVLTDDGTLWVNIGDSYNASKTGNSERSSFQFRSNKGSVDQTYTKHVVNSCKPKDLIGIPWLLAFALRADGWYLRQDIIWHKPNPMPESVLDRCTKSHEYIFLFSKNSKYYFDNEAIKEKADEKYKDRYKYSFNGGKQKEYFRPDGATNTEGMKEYTGKRNKRDVWEVEQKPTRIKFGGNKYGDSDDPKYNIYSGNEWIPTGFRNKRDVWTVTVNGFKEAHFATFPEKLVEPCILAGCPKGGGRT